MVRLTRTPNSMGGRTLRSRMDHYEFSVPSTIESARRVSTHGADADTLRRAAEASPIPRRAIAEASKPNEVVSEDCLNGVPSWFC